MLHLGEASATAVQTLLNQNISMWPEQSKQPVMPKDISNLDGEELSELFSRLTAWSNFVAGQLAAAQVDEVFLEKKLESVRAQLLLTKGATKAKGDTVTLIKAQVNADPMIVSLEEKSMAAYAYRKMIEVVSNNFERDIALISREITRRTNDFRSRKEKYTI